MKECFQTHKFSPEIVALLGACVSITEAYMEQGLRLTLRQLYYQLVVKNIINNKEREYKRLSRALSDARLAGMIDWSSIEDRVRIPRKPSEFDNIKDLMNAAVASYRLDRWEGQKHYVELWVEKDALAGILAPIAYEYHITLMVNRGYSSMTAMYDAGKRFLSNKKKGILLYLGDFDPSGEDMVRDIDERLQMFGAIVKVQKIALTMEQVEKYNPPPNPAKMSDSRAAGYVAAHGDNSWEVDALPPEVLDTIIRNALKKFIDRKAMVAVLEREKADIKTLMDKMEE